MVSTNYSARVADGQFQVTLAAECREEIGKEVPGTTVLPEQLFPGGETERP